MNPQNILSKRLLAFATAVLFSAGLTTANADEPCPGDDFGECKVLIEINAEDGDAGFHFLVDGDNLIHTMLFNPKHKRIFSYIARRELRKQFVTETFVESAEPLCWPDPDADDDEDVVLLADFLDLWSPGDYHFFGIGEGWEFSHGVTQLSFALPAAPAELEYDDSVISWKPGDDLGNCAELVGDGEDDEFVPNLEDLIAPGGPLYGLDPKDVPLAAFEVVLEPDYDEEDDPALAAMFNSLKFTVRIPAIDDADDYSFTVPADYLASLPPNTPMKSEVGAIGLDDNATFAEISDICVNEDDTEFPDDIFDGCGFGPDDD